MSNVCMIFSERKIDFLPKERYLKFTELGCISNIYIYVRFIYESDFFLSEENNNYKLSDNGKALLNKILNTIDGVHITNTQLTNKTGEEEIAIKNIKDIKNRKFLLSQIQNQFENNKLYYLKNEKK